MMIRLDKPSMKRYRFLRIFSFYACLTYHVNFLHISSSFGSLDRKSEFVAFFLGLSYLAHQLHIFRAFRLINRVRGVQGPDRFSDRQDSEIVEFSPVLHACPTNSNVGAPRDQQQAGSMFSQTGKLLLPM